MSDRLYRPILRQAWVVSNKHRWLMLFGIFVAVLGNGGVFHAVVNNYANISSQGDLFFRLKSILTLGIYGDILSNVSNFFTYFNIWLFLVFLVFLVIFAVVVWIVMSSYGALVFAVSRFHSTRPSDLHSSWNKGTGYFIRVFAISVFGKALLYGAVFLSSILFFVLYALSENFLWQSAWVVLLFVILVPFAWLLEVLVRFAVLYAVIEGKSVRESFYDAWELLVRRWLESIEMVIILFFLSIAIFIVWALSLFVVAFPFFLLIKTFFTLGFTSFFWISILLFLLFEAVLTVFLGAWFAVFRTAVWVYFFERVTSGQVFSRVVRWFTRLSA